MYKPKPIKPFKTLDDEADFWDTHDTSPLFINPKTPLEELPLMDPEKIDTLTIRMQRSVKEDLSKEAWAKGISVSTLARMWLIERVAIEKAQKNTPSRRKSYKF